MATIAIRSVTGIFDTKETGNNLYISQKMKQVTSYIYAGSGVYNNALNTVIVKTYLTALETIYPNLMWFQNSFYKKRLNLTDKKTNTLVIELEPSMYTNVFFLHLVHIKGNSHRDKLGSIGFIWSP